MNYLNKFMTLEELSNYFKISKMIYAKVFMPYLLINAFRIVKPILSCDKMEVQSIN